MVHLAYFSASSSANWRLYLGKAHEYLIKRGIIKISIALISQIWFFVGHLGEETTEAVALLLAVGIAPCGQFRKHRTVSFCAVVFQDVVPVLLGFVT